MLTTFCIQKTKFHLIVERLPQRSATLLVAEKVSLGKKIVSENVHLIELKVLETLQSLSTAWLWAWMRILKFLTSEKLIVYRKFWINSRKVPIPATFSEMTGIAENVPATSEDFRRFWRRLPNDAENVWRCFDDFWAFSKLLILKDNNFNMFWFH